MMEEEDVTATQVLNKDEARNVAEAVFVPVEWDNLKRKLVSEVEGEHHRVTLTGDDIRTLETMWNQLQKEAHNLQSIRARLQAHIGYPYTAGQQQVPSAIVEVREIQSLADTVGYVSGWMKEAMDSINQITERGREPLISRNSVKHLESLLDRLQGLRYQDLRRRLEDAEAKLGGVKPGWKPVYYSSLYESNPFAGKGRNAHKHAREKEHPKSAPLEEVHHKPVWALAPGLQPTHGGLEFLSEKEAHTVAKAAFASQWEELKRMVSGLMERCRKGETLSTEELLALERAWHGVYDEAQSLQDVKNRLLAHVNYPYRLNPTPVEVREVEALADNVSNLQQHLKDALVALGLLSSMEEGKEISLNELARVQSALDRIESVKFSDLRARLENAEMRLGGIRSQMKR